MPELMLDIPQLPSYTFTYVIKPLHANNNLKYNFVKWKIDKPQPAPDDDDDIVFDNTDG